MIEIAPAETDPPTAPAAAKKTPKKKPAVRNKPTGPTLSEQIDKIVAGCRDRKGMCYAAIIKAVAGSGVDVVKRRPQIKMSIKRKAESGSLVQMKGSGLSGSFKSGKGKSAVVVKKAKKPSAKKSPIKKSPSKKLGAKKPAAKKAGAKTPAAKKAAPKPKSPKKAAAPKTKAAKKPKSKSAKPKKTTVKK
ncbi:histone H1-like [Hypanus sabinus]|uniref:histone H1-like n=1 Tax=Hypanus sabinus TaxID=79690 RepID=UPI0028C3D5BA|nr:histone H1-like [Hypanus sabinus]